ncbi:MAG: hypothetical protein HZB51_00395 [Chloroflexi bacterium]|nr:hypothetical protein [Chloroflexota bacterium]
MHRQNRGLKSPLTIFHICFTAIMVAIALMFTSTITSAGGYSERLVNGDFEEGFGANGVGSNWVGFDNGGTAFYHFQDDVSPAFNYNGKHSQLMEISTVKYAVSEPERYIGIYQTVSVVAGQPYTLSLHGEMRLLPTDLDFNNWSYVVQYAIDQNGGTDWGKVDWQTLPWNNNYDWMKPGPLSHFSTIINATSNKMTVFVRALKKFPTPYRDLFVNVDGISLMGPIPDDGKAPQVDVVPPTFVYTTKPFPVHVTASSGTGIPSVKLFDEDKLVASVTNAVGPMNRQFDFAWTPAFTGTRTLKVQAADDLGRTTTISTTVNVVSIAEFLKNGNFEGGFRPNGIALQWGSFDNGGRNVFHQLYDDTWPAVVTSGKHSQLIEISTIGHGYADPYAESDRFAGICQVVKGLTPKASYYVTGRGAIRITEGDEHTTDWSWAAQFGYLVGDDPTCAQWTQVQNWQVLPWNLVGFRETAPQINSFTQVIFPTSDTITVYFNAWKKWAVGAREFLVNYDDLSVAGYKEPAPVATTTVTPTVTITTTVVPTSTPTPTATPTR